MITTLAAIAVFIAFALKEAHEDRKGKPVDAHAPDWVDRATFAFVVAVCCAYANIYTTDATVWGFLWKLLGFGLIAYGLFTPVFRWRLNRLRGMDARYIAPWSNTYDNAFYWLVCLPYSLKRGTLPWGEWVAWVHANYDDDADVGIHDAGVIAYAVEGLALLIGCAITLELWK